jgi:hypothetical protein
VAGLRRRKSACGIQGGRGRARPRADPFDQRQQRIVQRGRWGLIFLKRPQHASIPLPRRGVEAGRQNIAKPVIVNRHV